MPLFGKRDRTTRSAAPGVTLAPGHSVPLVRGTGPAVSMEKTAASGSVNLRKTAEVTQINMSKSGMLGVRADGVFVIDRSGSMNGDYRNGNVQTLAEMMLGLMLNFTPKITVVAFDTVVHPPFEVTLDNYRNVIAERVFPGGDMGPMGSTNLAAALEFVRDMVIKAGRLHFVGVLTDGVPNDFRRNPRYVSRDRTPTEKPGTATQTTAVVCDLARYAAFLKFAGVRELDYLDYLDDLEQFEPGARLLDNVDAKSYPGGMASITAERFADDMLDEWQSTIDAQLAAGILV